MLLVSILKEDAPGFTTSAREPGEWLVSLALAMVAALPVRLLNAERVALHPLTLTALTVALIRATVAEIPPPGAFDLYLAGFTYATIGIAAGAVAALALYARSSRRTIPGSVSSWVPLVVATIGWSEILYGVLVSAGFGSFGTPLLAAGLLTLSAGILSVASTSAKWRAGLALPATPIAAILLYLLLVFASGDYVPPTVWEVSTGYRGWVVTAYDMPACSGLERDGLSVVVKVDAAGHACTSDHWRSGWIVSQDVFFVDQGRRVEKVAEARESPNDAGVRVREHHDSQLGGCPMADEFFVGTADDLRRAGGTSNRSGLSCDLRPSR